MPIGFERTDKGTIQIVLLQSAGDVPCCLELAPTVLLEQLEQLIHPSACSAVADYWCQVTEPLSPLQRAWIAHAVHYLAHDALARQRVIRKIQAMLQQKNHPPVWLRDTPATMTATAALRTVLPIITIRSLIMAPAAADNDFLACMGSLAGTKLFYEVCAITDGYRLRMQARMEPACTITGQCADVLTMAGPIQSLLPLAAQLTTAYISAHPGIGMCLEPPLALVEPLKAALAQYAHGLPSHTICIQARDQQWMLSMPNGVAHWTCSTNAEAVMSPRSRA